MNILIDENGYLSRDNKDMFCPFNDGAKCGDHCPHFPAKDEIKLERVQIRDISNVGSGINAFIFIDTIALRLSCGNGRTIVVTGLFEDKRVNK